MIWSLWVCVLVIELRLRTNRREVISAMAFSAGPADLLAVGHQSGKLVILALPSSDGANPKVCESSDLYCMFGSISWIFTLFIIHYLVVIISDFDHYPSQSFHASFNGSIITWLITFWSLPYQIIRAIPDLHHIPSWSFSPTYLDHDHSWLPSLRDITLFSEFPITSTCRSTISFPDHPFFWSSTILLIISAPPAYPGRCPPGQSDPPAVLVRRCLRSVHRRPFRPCAVHPRGLCQCKNV